MKKTPIGFDHYLKGLRHIAGDLLANDGYALRSAASAHTSASANTSPGTAGFAPEPRPEETTPALQEARS